MLYITTLSSYCTATWEISQWAMGYIFWWHFFPSSNCLSILCKQAIDPCYTASSNELYLSFPPGHFPWTVQTQKCQNVPGRVLSSKAVVYASVPGNILAACWSCFDLRWLHIGPLFCLRCALLLPQGRWNVPQPCSHLSSQDLSCSNSILGKVFFLTFCFHVCYRFCSSEDRKYWWENYFLTKKMSSIT